MILTSKVTKLFTAFAAICALGLTLSSANAGSSKEMSKEMTAAVAPEPSFTGFYLGGNAGANWNEFDFTEYDFTVDQTRQAVGPITFTGRQNNGRDEMEFIGGGQIGYNFQFRHFVFGIEGDFQGAGDVDRQDNFAGEVIETNTITTVPLRRFTSFTDVKSFGRADTNWFASLRPRFGYAFGPVMLYVTGGVAFNDTDMSLDTRATTNEFLTVGATTTFVGSSFDRSKASESQTMVGWTAGGGMEWMIRPWLTAGVEYRHTEFDGENFAFGGNGGITSRNLDVGLVNDQVAVKVNVLFMNFFRR